MAIDEKTINKIKKEIRKGDETLPDILKKLPDIIPEKRIPKLSPEQREELKKFRDDYLEKFKEKKKRIPKVKPDPDEKNTPIIPKDFFKNPNRKLLPYKLPDKFIPNDRRKFYENMPYKIRPSDEMPGVQLLKKGGTVKGYKAGGEVKTDKSPNSGMITKRGWGKSRKT
jgi:hypothetical protein